ncbi:MAG: hypothetical protein KKD28_03245 [Chloroflexi bacterium]|nr:hypothetical protein [Chloroflexota bacterium]
MIRPPINQQITFLYTHDLKTTADFYENVLGLDLASIRECAAFIEYPTQVL